MDNLIIYGGSFDPIHNGHLNTARTIQHEFQFNRFIFLPCKIPVLKDATKASAEQRIEMLALGLNDYPQFSVDLREIQRKTPSYMIETLKSFREELGYEVSMTVLIGMDAFLQFPKWHHFQDILTLGNLLVISRCNIDEIYTETLNKLIQDHKISNKNKLISQAFGAILFYDAGQFDISSTALRHKIHMGLDISDEVPPLVSQYIKAQGLYQ